MNIYLVIFITLVAALMASAAQVMYKKGLTTKLRKMSDFVKLLKNKLVVGGLILYIIALLVYLYALSSTALSVAYPIFASTFIFITIISVFMLGEKITLKRALGTILIFIGIFIIALSAL